MIIKLIMAKPTKNSNNYEKITMIKLIMAQLTMNKINKAKLTNE